jgi:hypothetical protein
MTPVHIFWLVVVVLLASAIGGIVATLHLAHRERYRHHRASFFKLAAEIIRLDDAPMEVAIILRSLGATMDDFTSLKLVVLRAVFDYRPAIRDEHSRKLLAGVENAPPHVKQRFVQAYREAVKAVSYRSLFFGRVVRRSLCKKPRKPDGFSREVLSGLVRRGEKHRMNPALERLGRLTT